MRHQVRHLVTECVTCPLTGCPVTPNLDRLPPKVDGRPFVSLKIDLPGGEEDGGLRLVGGVSDTAAVGQ